MAYDREKIAVCRCPECFALELDQRLEYDDKAQEYYCVRCCYTGTADEIEEYFTFYKERKYRLMKEPEPFKVVDDA